jgi:uncharacterized RDD family membrane protein YckC
VRQPALDTIAVVETPEHVRFSFELAGPARRIAAYTLDLLVRALLMALFAVAGALGGLAGAEGLSGVGAGLWLALGFAVEWGYFVLLESLMNGQSVGKRAMRLRVVTVDGRPLSFAQIVLRNLLRATDVLPVFYALGVLVMAQDRVFRRLGDMVAGTLVISEQSKKLEEPLVITPAPTPRELYELPQRPELAPKELEAIERFLRRLNLYSGARELELAEMVAPLLARRMGLRYSHPVRFLALLYHRATRRGTRANS